ncbi:hypothetical protein B7R57_06140 [Staphylococcus aureus]|nr:hypothetical protein B7473_09565 [Staphylococcus aureus]AUJ57459.1 hypothetical protein B7474_09100 [Staphylococcus aureus]AUW98741.1 hypothetical protein B7R57_06140 [Staphylococcus aureus]AVS42021.1 hypothetical protein C9J90_12095 [Staphylococcus aureus]PGF13571.1 hypothetical protein CRE11_00480 [Staphylococcus aureus]
MTYFFGINQLIIGRNKVYQVLTKSIIKYSSPYLITLYLGFLLITLDSHSNIYHYHSFVYYSY